MPRIVRCGLIQARNVLGANHSLAQIKKAMIDKHLKLIEQAAKKRVQILCLQELFYGPYFCAEQETRWYELTEKVPDGPTTRLFAALAKKLGIYLTVPLLEVVHPPEGKKGDPVYFNTVCLVTPKGEMAAHYRKLAPWPHPEQSWATPGDRGVQPFDTEYGRVGLAICFDIHTILEKYEKHKLWALLYPIAWVDQDHPADWFWHRLPARVAPFKHYLIGANWSVDRAQRWRGYGFSTIISPEGKVVATAKSLYGSEIVYATLPTAWVDEGKK